MSLKEKEKQPSKPPKSSSKPSRARPLSSVRPLVPISSSRLGDAIGTAKKSLSELLTPISQCKSLTNYHTLWVPRPATLTGPFTDGILEEFITALHLPTRTVAGYCQHKGGKLVYFISAKDKEDFANTVGVSHLVKIRNFQHLFTVQDPCKAQLAVSYMIMGVPLEASDEHVAALLSCITSVNPLCKLISWARVFIQGSLTDKVAARWTLAPELILCERSIEVGEITLTFAPMEYSLHCSHCKVKGHGTQHCPFLVTTPPSLVTTPTGGSFSSNKEFFQHLQKPLSSSPPVSPPPPTPASPPPPLLQGRNLRMTGRRWTPRPLSHQNPVKRPPHHWIPL